MGFRKIKETLTGYLDASRLIRFLLLGTVTAVFSLTLYPNLGIIEHDYSPGDVAERDIKAPIDFFVEDPDAGEIRRREAAENVLTVYDHDTGLLNRTVANVESAFGMMREAVSSSSTLETPGETFPVAEDGEEIHRRVWVLKDRFDAQLGISLNNGAYGILEQQGFDRRVADFIIEIVSQILGNGVVANKEVLLREGDNEIILRDIATQQEQATGNLRRLYGLDQAKTMVRVVAQPLVKDLNYTLVNLIVDIAQRLLQPNITLNRDETEKRRRRAAADIKPVLYQIKAGEMLLREGERVTAPHLRKLQALSDRGRQERGWLRGVGVLLLMMALTATCYFLLQYGHRRRPLTSNRDVLFIAVLVVVYCFLPRVSVRLFESLFAGSPFRLPETALYFGIPLASAAMTVCLFFRLDVAISFAVVLAVQTGMMFHNRLDLFIYFFVSSAMAAYWIRHCRERKVFVHVGIRVGGLNALLAMAAVPYGGGEMSTGLLLWHAALGISGGLFSGMVSAGVVPLLEMTFGYTTDITLLELANLERPILRRLMIEAPGTYHHSVVVGSLVEAAAAEIGANPLLAKVCGYYHDIGKLRKPLYFVENQTNGQNRHDKLTPSMSSLILLSHVKEGVEIARRHKLGDHIIAAIHQHHGTSTIRYFYEKARTLSGPDAVKLENYQYPGPKPQTREIALVMLADVVEAASRTLANPTPSRIQGLVQDLMRRIFNDGQLDNCDLTLRDLHAISECFIKILNGIHHHRIDYPEKTNGKHDKGKNGGTDQHPSGDPAGGREPAGEKSEGGVRGDGPTRE